MGTPCWARGSSAGPAPALATLAHGITTGVPAMRTMRHTTSCASAPLATRVRARAGTGQQGRPAWGCRTPAPTAPSLQGPAATAAPLVTLGLRRWMGGSAGPASATTTSTPATRRAATPARDSACAACTTRLGPAVPTASRATTAMPCSAAAGVSGTAGLRGLWSCGAAGLQGCRGCGDVGLQGCGGCRGCRGCGVWDGGLK